MKCESTGTCPETGKLMFSTYKECVKFARYVDRCNRERRKDVGSNYERGGERGACKESNHIDVHTKVIYKCVYCGAFHFSSHKKSVQSEQREREYIAQKGL